MNKYKVKVGDIFYDDNGIANFYQVVQVYDSGRVRIREIEKTETPTECGYEFKASPISNEFKPKIEGVKVDRYTRIKDNDKGVIKVIQEFDDGEYYIDFYIGYAKLYKNKPIISSYWSVWMR